MWEVITGFEVSVLLAFIAAGMLLNITPGQDFIFVSASAVQGGPKIGMAAGAGVCTGVAVHVVMAAAGVSALLIAYPSAYYAIKYLGAAYLLCLAYQSWQASGELGEGRAALSLTGAFRRGFITNVLNPKTALFIFAFIPQFTDPAIGPIWMQILFLGFIFFFFGLLFDVALAFSAGYFSRGLRARVGILNKLIAVVFGGLALRLVWS